MPSFHLPANPALCTDLDGAALAPLFARHGRIHLPEPLAPADALRLSESLGPEAPWRRNLNVSSGNVSIPLETFQAQPAEWRATVDAELRREAGHAFHYLFDTYPLSDEIEAGRRIGHPAEAVYDAMNGPAFLAFLRALTGDARIAYCDAQLTRYLPGHFLTRHDDAVAGKDRLFAYVLNLTPVWKADWGGVLMFLDEDGHVAEGYTPAMNALNLFRVPMAHLVSEVASYAPAARLSITGWVRAKGPLL